MESKPLNQIYPQKERLKFICRLLYFTGCGDFWYEPTERSTLQKSLYPIWAFMSHAYLSLIIFNQFMAYFRRDLTEKELNDLMQHTFGHSSVYCKIVILCLQRNRVKNVLKIFLEEASYAAMEHSRSLKQIYPQKERLKFICRLLYVTGCGDFWYEPMERSTLQKSLYPIWAFISHAYLSLIILNEFMAYLRTDLTEKELNDLRQHTFAHSSVYCKIVVLCLQKNRVKPVLKKFMEESRSIYSSNDIDKAAMAKSFRTCTTMGFICYGTLCLAELDGVRAHIKEGIPIRAEVTFYPTPSHSGLFVNILRFFMEFHWFYLVAVMMLVDSLVVCSFVFIQAKFQVIQLYFKDMENVFKDKSKTDEELKKHFIDGIKLHEDALWSATNIQYSLGTIYSVQIFESLSLLVLCLIKLVTSERTIVLLIANLSYTFTMIFLTGVYMLTAGDITHEASMLSTSIFHSGWELHHKKSDLRTLAVLAIQRSQVPVYMTAFGIIKLSYVNFISVLRSSYSFFAVMY